MSRTDAVEELQSVSGAQAPVVEEAERSCCGDSSPAGCCAGEEGRGSCTCDSSCGGSEDTPHGAGPQEGSHAGAAEESTERCTCDGEGSPADAESCGCGCTAGESPAGIGAEGSESDAACCCCGEGADQGAGPCGCAPGDGHSGIAKEAGEPTESCCSPSCCGGSEGVAQESPAVRASQAEGVRQAVREGYARIAEGTAESCCTTSSCCGSGNADQVAQAVGYSEAELATLPDGANMGLSCGNPTALAELSSGEVVVDLGSGGGFDVFVAGQKVGDEGRSIGVDFTPEMLAKARGNVAAYTERTGLDNVDFRLGEIEHLPLADASVDVVISNCVINLSPDKEQVWREIARVLKPGGRVAVSDLALLRPLPPEVAEMVEALVGCVAGAVLVEQTERMAREAGLANIELEPKQGYIDAMEDWNDPLYLKIIERLPEGTRPGEFVTSLNVSARKP